MEEPEFQRVGDLLRLPWASDALPEREVAAVWGAAVGHEVAQNAQPLRLDRGRLVVATSSSVWAQTLQLMADQIVERVNEVLGARVVERALFQPAGWDPPAGPGEGQSRGGAGREGESAKPPGRSASSMPGAGAPRPSCRQLTREEENAVEQIRQAACDRTLGERIAAAMRASLAVRRDQLAPAKRATGRDVGG